MIELRETTRVLGMWFGGAPGFDWLAVVLKQEGESWQAIHRVRIHLDDKAFDSNDEKIWERLDSKSEERAAGIRLRAAMGEMGRRLGAITGAEVEYLPLDCNGEEAGKRLHSVKWAECRTERR